jgi:uncharacterized protein (TIGR00266 family)
LRISRRLPICEKIVIASHARRERVSTMQFQIAGTVMQTLAIDLMPGETVFSQTNCMCWMNDAIDMNTNTGGGFLAGVGRMFGGGSLFITDFTARGNGHVAFAPRFPGTIMPVQLAPGESVICRKQTFFCAEKSVTLDIAWQQRIGAGFFGGQGFILQRVTGPGTVFLDLSGEIVERDLAAGERLLVHAGHVGAIDPTVQFDIQRVPGFKNILFGGEGLFLAVLTGPGHIVLQSMPILNLAEEIAHYLPHNEGSSGSSSAGTAIAAGGIGAILGGLFGGDDRS